mmetsp:Transcript_79006/g.207409  ORF Transcript_79006/g.207409 Transcript_79006/m.207409 type:complete len:180 (-) Transcript_79006:19-558(-)
MFIPPMWGRLARAPGVQARADARSGVLVVSAGLAAQLLAVSADWLEVSDSWRSNSPCSEAVDASAQTSIRGSFPLPMGLPRRTEEGRELLLLRAIRLDSVTVRKVFFTLISQRGSSESNIDMEVFKAAITTVGDEVSLVESCVVVWSKQDMTYGSRSEQSGNIFPCPLRTEVQAETRVS